LKIPIEEGQTTQWPKETGQKDKQRSVKHTHKTKSRVTRSPLKTRGELFWENVASIAGMVLHMNGKFTLEKMK
jgi:hypothetical protein